MFFQSNGNYKKGASSLKGITNLLLITGLVALSGCNKTELPGAMALADADINQQKIVVNQVAEVEFESFDPESRILAVTNQGQTKHYILTPDQAKDLGRHLNLGFHINGFVDGFHGWFQGWFNDWNVNSNNTTSTNNYNNYSYIGPPCPNYCSMYNPTYCR